MQCTGTGQGGKAAGRCTGVCRLGNALVACGGCGCSYVGRCNNCTIELKMLSTCSVCATCHNLLQADWVSGGLTSALASSQWRR
jgi:hypothetical protein